MSDIRNRCVLVDDDNILWMYNGLNDDYKELVKEIMVSFKVQQKINSDRRKENIIVVR